MKVSMTIALLLFGLVFVSARAEEPDYTKAHVLRALLEQVSADPAAMQSLSPRARAAVEQVVQNSEWHFESRVVKVGYCEGLGEKRKIINRAWYGDPVSQFSQFEMKQVGKWCYDGNSITRLKSPMRRGIAIYLVGWQFEGYHSEWQDGSAGNWEYEDFFQGKFRWCVGGCIFEQNPWLYMTIYGDGFGEGSGGF